LPKKCAANISGVYTLQVDDGRATGKLSDENQNRDLMID